jgi:hypothetical protein
MQNFCEETSENKGVNILMNHGNVASQIFSQAVILSDYNS